MHWFNINWLDVIVPLAIASPFVLFMLVVEFLPPPKRK